MASRDDITDALDTQEFLVHLGFDDLEDKGNDWHILCPFHEDIRKSLSIRKSDGVCYCYGCGFEGSIFDFYMAVNKVPLNQAFADIAGFAGVDNSAAASATKRPPAVVEPEPEIERPPIDPLLVTTWHNDLFNIYHAQHNYLNTAWGLDDAAIRTYMLGFDGERFTIPIKDETDTVVNVRRYMPNAGKSEEKMKNFYQVVDKELYKYGRPARLYPLEALGEGDNIVLVEGEKDCLVARQFGFNAITTTGGANTWRDEWNELFRGKRVYICYDNDEGGRKGASKIALALEPIAGVYICELPDVEGTKGFDITDYFMVEGASAHDFQQILNDAKTFSKPLVIKEGEPEPVHVPLALASMAQYTGQPIITRVMVSGKDMAPYIIPSKIEVVCNCSDLEQACVTCPRWTKAGVNRGVQYRETIELDGSNPNLLKLINCSDTQQKGYLKEIGGVHRKCNSGYVSVKETGNVQQIIVIPELDTNTSSLDELEYVNRNAYFMGHDVVANRSYEMHGYTWADPRTQYATHVFDHKNDMQDSIRAFEMTPDVAKELHETFALEPGETIQEKLDDIYNYFVRNVHGIRGRSEIQFAFDLVWHSVLNFNFIGQSVRKGWLEGLIIGDTSQGKTELTTRMRDYYNLGQRITGEKTSAAGLVGGLQKMGERWILQWGAYPQNDRRAMLIDEYSSLREEEIGNMTDLRSTGVAEIVKIRMERTNARVRVLACSNLRSGEMMRNLMQGIEGVKMLMGKNEDIRRLDFAITAATGEVDLDMINMPAAKLPVARKVYSRSACKNRVLWAWSRNRPPNTNQVIFTDDAESAILTHARAMGNKYHPRIPLVEPSDQRLKIARMAVSLAAMLFSTDETYENVVVNKDHVEYVVNWLQSQYDKPSMAYDQWSETAWSADRFPPGVEELLAEYLVDYPSAEDIIMFMSKQNRPFRQNDFEASTGLDRELIRPLIRMLIRHNALDNTPGGFKAQPCLNDLLRKLKNGVPVGAKKIMMKSGT